MGKDKTELLYFCVGFHELSHLTEKKIAVKVQLFREGFLVGMYPALLKAHLNCLVIALYNCTHTHPIELMITLTMKFNLEHIFSEHVYFGSMPQRIYNSHYSNGVPVMFNS